MEKLAALHAHRKSELAVKKRVEAARATASTLDDGHGGKAWPVVTVRFQLLPAEDDPDFDGDAEEEEALLQQVEGERRKEVVVSHVSDDLEELKRQVGDAMLLDVGRFMRGGEPLLDSRLWRRAVHAFYAKGGAREELAVKRQLAVVRTRLTELAHKDPTAADVETAVHVLLELAVRPDLHDLILTPPPRAAGTGTPTSGLWVAKVRAQSAASGDSGAASAVGAAASPSPTPTAVPTSPAGGAGAASPGASRVTTPAVSTPTPTVIGGYVRELLWLLTDAKVPVGTQILSLQTLSHLLSNEKHQAKLLPEEPGGDIPELGGLQLFQTVRDTIFLKRRPGLSLVDAGNMCEAIGAVVVALASCSRGRAGLVPQWRWHDPALPLPADVFLGRTRQGGPGPQKLIAHTHALGYRGDAPGPTPPTIGRVIMATDGSGPLLPLYDDWGVRIGATGLPLLRVYAGMELIDMLIGSRFTAPRRYGLLVLTMLAVHDPDGLADARTRHNHPPPPPATPPPPPPTPAAATPEVAPEDKEAADGEGGGARRASRASLASRRPSDASLAQGGSVAAAEKAGAESAEAADELPADAADVHDSTAEHHGGFGDTGTAAEHHGGFGESAAAGVLSPTHAGLGSETPLAATPTATSTATSPTARRLRARARQRVGPPRGDHPLHVLESLTHSQKRVSEEDMLYLVVTISSMRRSKAARAILGNLRAIRLLVLLWRVLCGSPDVALRLVSREQEEAILARQAEANLQRRGKGSSSSAKADPAKAKREAEEAAREAALMAKLGGGASKAAAPSVVRAMPTSTMPRLMTASPSFFDFAKQGVVIGAVLRNARAIKEGDDAESTMHQLAQQHLAATLWAADYYMRGGPSPDGVGADDDNSGWYYGDAIAGADVSDDMARVELVQSLLVAHRPLVQRCGLGMAATLSNRLDLGPQVFGNSVLQTLIQHHQDESNVSPRQVSVLTGALAQLAAMDHDGVREVLWMEGAGEYLTDLLRQAFMPHVRAAAGAGRSAAKAHVAPGHLNKAYFRGSVGGDCALANAMVQLVSWDLPASDQLEVAHDALIALTWMVGPRDKHRKRGLVELMAFLMQFGDLQTIRFCALVIWCLCHNVDHRDEVREDGGVPVITGWIELLAGAYAHGIGIPDMLDLATARAAMLAKATDGAEGSIVTPKERVLAKERRKLQRQIAEELKASRPGVLHEVLDALLASLWLLLFNSTNAAQFSSSNYIGTIMRLLHVLNAAAARKPARRGQAAPTPHVRGERRPLHPAFVHAPHAHHMAIGVLWTLSQVSEVRGAILEEDAAVTALDAAQNDRLRSSLRLFALGFATDLRRDSAHKSEAVTLYHDDDGGSVDTEALQAEAALALEKALVAMVLSSDPQLQTTGVQGIVVDVVSNAGKTYIATSGGTKRLLQLLRRVMDLSGGGGMVTREMAVLRLLRRKRRVASRARIFHALLNLSTEATNQRVIAVHGAEMIVSAAAGHPGEAERTFAAKIMRNMLRRADNRTLVYRAQLTVRTTTWREQAATRVEDPEMKVLRERLEREAGVETKWDDAALGRYNRWLATAVNKGGGRLPEAEAGHERPATAPAATSNPARPGGAGGGGGGGGFAGVFLTAVSHTHGAGGGNAVEPQAGPATAITPGPLLRARSSRSALGPHTDDDGGAGVPWAGVKPSIVRINSRKAGLALTPQERQEWRRTALGGNGATAATGAPAEDDAASSASGVSDALSPSLKPDERVMLSPENLAKVQARLNALAEEDAAAAQAPTRLQKAKPKTKRESHWDSESEGTQWVGDGRSEQEAVATARAAATRAFYETEVAPPADPSIDLSLASIATTARSEQTLNSEYDVFERLGQSHTAPPSHARKVASRLVAALHASPAARALLGPSNPSEELAQTAPVARGPRSSSGARPRSAGTARRPAAGRTAATEPHAAAGQRRGSGVAGRAVVPTTPVRRPMSARPRRSKATGAAQEREGAVADNLATPALHAGTRGMPPRPATAGAAPSPVSGLPKRRGRTPAHTALTGPTLTGRSTMRPGTDLMRRAASAADTAAHAFRKNPHAAGFQATMCADVWSPVHRKEPGPDLGVVDAKPAARNPLHGDAHVAAVRNIYATEASKLAAQAKADRAARREKLGMHHDSDSDDFSDSDSFADTDSDDDNPVDKEVTTLTPAVPYGWQPQISSYVVKELSEAAKANVKRRALRSSIKSPTPARDLAAATGVPADDPVEIALAAARPTTVVLAPRTARHRMTFYDVPKWVLEEDEDSDESGDSGSEVDMFAGGFGVPGAAARTPKAQSGKNLPRTGSDRSKGSQDKKSSAIAAAETAAERKRAIWREVRRKAIEFGKSDALKRHEQVTRLIERQKRVGAALMRVQGRNADGTAESTHRSPICEPKPPEWHGVDWEGMRSGLGLKPKPVSVHMAKFKHVDGSRSCQGVFQHYTLPDGTQVHYYHDDTMHEVVATRGLQAPPAPLRLRDAFLHSLPVPRRVGGPTDADSPPDWKPSKPKAPMPTRHELPVEAGHTCGAAGPLGCRLTGIMPETGRITLQVVESKEGRKKRLERARAAADADAEADRGGGAPGSQTGSWRARRAVGVGGSTRSLRDADATRAWTIDRSVFAARRKEAASKDYYNSEIVQARSFKVDWKRVTDKRSVRELVAKLGSEEELVQLRHVMRKHYNLLADAFNFFAAKKGGESHIISFMSYFDLLDECGIVDESSEHVRRQHCEIMFKVTNMEEDGSTAQDLANADRALMRFELLEIVVRLGIAKYLLGGETSDVSDSVSMICERNITPALESWRGLFDSDQFRRERMYSEDVDLALRPHVSVLRAIFNKVCLPKTYVKKGARMSQKEWIKLLSRANLFNEDFTRTEASFAFVLSKMNVIDELMQQGPWTTLSFVDFMEALTRVAEMLTLPTKADLTEFAVKDAFAYDKILHDRRLQPTRRPSSQWDMPKTRPLAEKVARFMELFHGRLDRSGKGTLTVDAVKKW